jgi:hypothetical protein
MNASDLLGGLYGIAICFVVSIATSFVEHSGVCASVACIAAVYFSMVVVPVACMTHQSPLYLVKNFPSFEWAQVFAMFFATAYLLSLVGDAGHCVRAAHALAVFWMLLVLPIICVDRAQCAKELRDREKLEARNARFVAYCKELKKLHMEAKSRRGGGNRKRAYDQLIENELYL